jgi:Uma2 family endonuclease
MTGFSEDPGAPYQARLSKAEFFSWLERQEGGRFELKDGQIVIHAGTIRRHAWLAHQFGKAFSSRLDWKNWTVGTADIAVELGDDIRYPDVVVERRRDAGETLTTTAPVLIVEVLSPSSAGRDMSIKLAEYTALPSLEAYIVASQDEPIVWVWQRQGEAHAFPKLPSEIAGRDRAIDIPALGISLPLGDIYRGIGGG